MKKVFCFLFFTIISFSWSFGQSFVQIATGTGKMNYAEVSQTYGVALYGGDQNYLSTNQGVTWSTINNSIGSNIDAMEMKGAAIVNSSIYCLIGYKNFAYHIVRTTNSGASWSIVLSTAAFTQDFKAISVNGNNLIVTAKNGIYRSVDAGITWSFVTLSTGGEVSPFAEYNGGSNSWFIGHYNTDLQISTDLGASWSPINYNLNSTDIVDASYNNSLLLTQNTATGNRYLKIDATNNFIDSIDINQGQIYGVIPNSRASYLPNGDILTANTFLYYNIDSTTGNLYHLSSPTFYLSNFVDLDLGTTFGLSIKHKTSGNAWVAYLIDPSVTTPKYVDANVNIYNFTSTCAGDDIVAAPYSDYADSVKWYVNNVFITINNTLNYATPTGVFTTYNVKLITYYNGISHDITRQIIFNSPQPPHPYTYIVDSLACYDQSHLVFINPNNGVINNTSIEILLGGQNVIGPLSMGSGSNVYLSTPQITQDDTLQIITYNNGACDNTSDTVSIPLIVGPDLLSFNLLSHDTIICLGEDVPIAMVNTNPLYSYTFSGNHSFPHPSWSQQTVGDSDTLNLVVGGIPFYLNYNIDSSTYVPSVDLNLDVQVTDPITGCISSTNLSTIVVHRPTAYFDLHSHSFLKNDTVNLSNGFITENRLWFSDDLSSSFIQNATDTIPLIIPDTTGFFGIKLKNEPIPGCIDSTEHLVHITDPTVNMDTSCSSAASHPVHILHKIQIDQFGNRYEISTDYHVFEGENPLYRLRKYGSNDSLIWERNANGNIWNLNGAVLEDLDFDTDGNPICAFWINGEYGYSDSLFNFVPAQWSVFENWCMLLKLDKSTGNIIWSKRINDLLNLGVLYTGLRPTDVVVDCGKIHLSVYRPTAAKIYYMTLDLNGDLLNTSTFELTWNNNGFIPHFNQLNSNLNLAQQHSIASPQMAILSTGEVIAVGYYTDVFFANHIQLDMINSPGGVFAMKYDPSTGVVSDVTKIAEIGLQYTSQRHRLGIEIDDNDNITLSGQFQRNYHTYDISILDSVISMRNGNFILNMDQDFNMNWLTLGTYGHIYDFQRIDEAGDYIALVSSKDNISFGQDSSHIMAGVDVPTTIQYTNIPTNVNSWPILDLSPSQIFFARFNSHGIPIELTKFEDVSGNPSWQYPRFKMASTPCGNIMLAGLDFDTLAPSVIDINGQVLTIDSSSIFHFNPNCSSPNCSYVNAPDTVNTCSILPNIDIQLCNYYNLDSIVFDLYKNDTLVNINQTANVVLGEFQINLPTSGTYMIAIQSPTIDTLVINNTNNPPVTFNFNDSICYGDQLNITTSSSNYSFAWLDSAFMGQNLNIDEADYSAGINLIDVEIMNGTCVTFDTLTVFVEDQFFYPSYSTPNSLCFGQNVSIGAASTQYNYSWLGGTFSGQIINLDSTDYVIGLNTIDVTITLGICQYFDTITLTVNNCLGLVENGLFFGQINPNPNNGVFSINFGDTYNEIKTEIMDVNGRVVFRDEFLNSNEIIVETRLDPGTYFVKIDFDNFHMFEKIIIIQ